MSRAIISVDDKTGLVPFMQGLDDNGWELFATSGTQEAFREATGLSIPSLADLVEAEIGSAAGEREAVAQQISELMLTRRAIQLACVNLREPRLEASEGAEAPKVSLDLGGIAMIGAAVESRTLVVTQPDLYERVLDHIRSGTENDPEFQRQLKIIANQHVADHRATADSLRA